MEQWKELKLLKASTAVKSLGQPWPELQATGVSRADLCSYLMAFGENGVVKSVDMPSVTTQADTKALAAAGLTVAWVKAAKERAPKKAAAAAAAPKEEKKDEEKKDEEKKEEEAPAADEAKKDDDEEVAEEKKDEEKEEAKEEEETKEDDVTEEKKEEAAPEEVPAGVAGKCVANTSITGDRRTHAVAAGLRALLQVDRDTPDATQANVIEVAGADPKAELSPAFAPTYGIRVSGSIYKSPDHYLASQKADLFGSSSDEKEKILNAGSAEAARKLGTLIKNFDQEKWHEHRAEAVFAAVIAAVYATRKSYYTLITSGQASFSCESRPAWAEGLQHARLFLMCRDFGAHLFSHPNIDFTYGNRITLLGGIKGHGVKIQALCEDCLAKPRSIGGWQRLLYSLRHGRNLASAVNRSGVILLISDLLYKESTDPDIIRLCINICAAIANELGFLDKETQGFLIKYYLGHRDTWTVLGAIDNLGYSDDISKQAFAIFFPKGTKGVDKNDIYHRTHAVKVLAKLLTSPKATVLTNRMSSPESVNTLIDSLSNCVHHSSLGGWNDLVAEMSTAAMKCLLIIGKHLVTKKEDLSFFVPKCVQFLSSAYNDHVQSHCAVLLEKSPKDALKEESVKQIVKLVRKEFIELKVNAPDHAEDLCDLLAALAPRDTEAADLLFTLGTESFSSWAMPVLTATNAAQKNKSALSKIEGFAAKVSAILRTAIDHSDETAIADIAAFVDTLSLTETGVEALQDAGMLSPLLQWVTEIEGEDQTSTQDSLLTICQRLTANVLVAEENSHILQLMLDVLVNVRRPRAQGCILQGFVNLVAAGTTKATFENLINLQALSKTMIGKQNAATVAKVLTSLKIEVKEASKSDASKKSDAARTQGSKKGEVDTMTFQSNSDNSFQLLVAKPKKDGAASDAKTAGGGGAVSPKIKAGDQVKTFKGFTTILAKSHKDKDGKKKNKFAQRVSVHKKPAQQAPRERDQEREYKPRDRDAKTGGAYNERDNSKYASDRRYDERDSRYTGGNKYHKDDDDNGYKRRSTYNERDYDARDVRDTRDTRDHNNDRYGDRNNSRTAAPAAAGAPPTAGAGARSYRDPIVPAGGGKVVAYQKEAREPVVQDSGARVFKTQAKGAKGVNLGQLNHQISQSRKPEEKKPTTWAGVVKFANEREAREERAEQDAKEQRMLLVTERERIENMRKKAVAAPPSIDPVSELFKKLLPGVATVRSVVSTDRDMAEMDADKRKMEQRQAERDRQRQRDEERHDAEQKRHAEAAAQQQHAERLRRENEQRQQQEVRDRQERAEVERQEGLRKAREDAERAAAAVSGGSGSAALSWNTSSQNQADTAAAIKSNWDSAPATINNQQPPQQSTWGTSGAIPAAQPAPLGQNRGGMPGQQQFAGGFGVQQPQQGQFQQHQQPRNNQFGQQNNNNANQGPVGGRPGHNNSHPWQQQQQQAQQVQQHWQTQQAQFRVQQPNQGGGMQGGGMGGIPPPMHQANQGIPQQQMQANQQQGSGGGGAPQANYYQTSQGTNNGRLNAGAGVFNGRLQ